MPFLSNAVHHPRRLFLRRALFQIHLWAGVLLALYVVVIALSGSILVFEDELAVFTLPAGLSRYDPGHMASLSFVVARFTTEYPAAHLETIDLPSPVLPAFSLRAKDAGRHIFNLVADPQTGSLHRVERTWLDWVRDLHIYLLLGEKHGVQVNAIGAATLLLIALTGIVIWWPGLRTWARGLRINFSAKWRRMNFDLHNAIGFWTLGIVSWWALSGFYFGFYKQVAAAINAVSPIRNMVAPTPLAASTTTSRVPLEQILQAAASASPAGRLFSLSDPALTGQSVYASMDLGQPGDFSHRDIVTIDTGNARVLSVWHYGANQSAGDWILWAMHPLHFGTLWGTAVKVLWCVLGLSLAVLSVTGLLMYWNRWLRHRLKLPLKSA